jgi:hypothetical protein
MKGIKTTRTLTVVSTYPVNRQGFPEGITPEEAQEHEQELEDGELFEAIVSEGGSNVDGVTMTNWVEIVDMEDE